MRPLRASPNPEMTAMPTTSEHSLSWWGDRWGWWCACGVGHLHSDEAARQHYNDIQEAARYRYQRWAMGLKEGRTDEEARAIEGGGRASAYAEAEGEG